MMIINAPTGMYKSLFGWVTPNNDSIYNVTWYISSNEPPTSRDNFIQIPYGSSLELMPQRVYDKTSRRKAVGQLVFTTEKAIYTDVGSNKKQFEDGQVLESEDIMLIGSDDIPTNSEMSIRHNTNILDIESYLDDDTSGTIDQINTLYEDADKLLESLHTQFTSVRSSVCNVDFEIKEIQKSINEINKAISAVQLVYPSGSDIESQLAARLGELESELTVKKSEYDVLMSESEVLKDKIREVSQIVR